MCVCVWGGGGGGGGEGGEGKGGRRGEVFSFPKLILIIALYGLAFKRLL